MTLMKILSAATLIGAVAASGTALAKERTSSLATEFGPGDTGYVGGRWWIDANGDNEMDADDVYFLCPLLGPGRDEL